MIKWKVCLDRVTRDAIEAKVSKLDMLSHIRIYWTAEAPATFVHLVVKHGNDGFKRNFWTYSMKSKGANLLRKCEVPRFWTSTLWYADI